MKRRRAKLTRATKVFLALVLTLIVATTIAFAAPWLVMLGFMFFIVPGAILAVSPTALFYLPIFTVPWFFLRSSSNVLALRAAAGAVLTIAFGVPSAMNELSRQELVAAEESDIVPAAPIAPARTIALLPAGGYSQSAEYCSDLCLLLLYNGVAERVISLAPEGQRAKPTLFRIERREACDAGRIKDRTWTSEHTAAAIVNAVRLRVAAGECLIAEAPGDAVPDLTIIRRADVVKTDERDRLLLRIGHIDSYSVEVSAGGSVLARISERQTRMLVAPLFLNLPIFAELSVGEWEWARRDTDNPKLDVLAALLKVTSFDLSIPSDTDLEELRRSIDAVLDDVAIAASDGRFALVGDYYKALDRAGLQPGDAERLVRLIGDDRVQLFKPFPPAALTLKDAPARFREPLLARLSRLPPEALDTTHTLQEIAGRLAAGAYRDDYAALDELLATHEGQLRFPALIPRLADRGNAVVPRLVAIIKESPDVVNWRSGGIAAAAMEGLCMLGPEAKAALPELRQIASEDVIPPYIQRNDRWRMSLVKIGARAGEFEKPSDVSGTQSDYEQRLAKDAQDRSCAGF